MAGLSVQVQQDFSGGSYQAPARELIPKNGVAYARNALLDVDDGTIFKRGGSAYKTTSSFAAALTFLWDGQLAGGQRTVIGSASAFGVIAADDATPTSIGGSGTSGKRPAVANGLLFIPNGASAAAGTVTVYGGSRKATYSTGTLSVASGATAVTGVGTTWLTNVDAGMILTAGGVVLGAVKSVESNTGLTLTSPTRAVAAAAAYSSVPVYQFTPLGGVTVDAVAAASDPARLVVASGSKVAFSTAGDPFTFADTDYHELSQGSLTLGMESLRGALFVFSTQGVFTITGMDFDLTDAQGNVQHRLEQINRDVILWDQRGIAGAGGSLVVPCVDDVYLVSASAAPQPLSTAIHVLYRGYAQASYRCGHAAVHKNHYFLPVINGTTHVDTLVLRMSGGGWTFWDGHGGTSTAFATRAPTSTAAPLLLSAGGARVLDLTGTFTPTAANKTDADTTVPVFEVITRDYTTGGLRRNLVKKIRLRYELNDAGNDNPTLQAYYSTGQVVTGNPLWGAVTWGAFTWGASDEEQFAQLSTPQANGPESVESATWQVITTESGVRPRFARFKFASASPSSRLVVRSLEMFTRPGGRQ